MAVIWIIEKPKSHLTAAAALVGDFAVRLFSSFDSFMKIQRLNHTSSPDAVVVDLDDVLLPAAEICASVNDSLPEARLLFVFSDAKQLAGLDSSIVNNGKARTFAKPIASMAFPMFVKSILEPDEGSFRLRGDILHFRDLVLDYGRSAFKIIPNETEEELSPKEARLLRLFLERPGVTLSREDIKLAVWEKTFVSETTINSQISRLRQRLRGSEVTIENVYGGQYVLR